MFIKNVHQKRNTPPLKGGSTVLPARRFYRFGTKFTSLVQKLFNRKTHECSAGNYENLFIFP